eukprot:TRINITY_DN8799_c0_g1_i1.p1 TRINITY_DN8799_c0_g1~~TRINITY_DN8799_c0_g1_i1.p1  ORF type:complete len:117 (-),score=14.91 TRINITY_DN8799_c0_g1_i1:97-447(-)
MGMAHSSSGRIDFTYVDLYYQKRFELTKNETGPDESFIPKTLLKKMLRRERVLLSSTEYRNKLSDAPDELSLSKITNQLQEQVMQEFHLEEDKEGALYSFQHAIEIYPELREEVCI